MNLYENLLEMWIDVNDIAVLITQGINHCLILRDHLLQEVLRQLIQFVPNLILHLLSYRID